MRTDHLPRRRAARRAAARPVARTVALVAVLVALLAACSSSGGTGPAASPPTTGVTSPAASGAPGGGVVSTADGIAGDDPSSTDPSTPASAASDTQANSASSSAAPSRPVPPAGFVGTWYGHGRALVIAANGTVDVSFRLTVTCTDTVTTGCDRVDGNGIVDGGHAAGVVSAVTNATTIRVDVRSSTAPKDIPVGTVKVGHDVGHHAVAIFTSTFQNAPFCGSDAPSGYCGA